MQMLSRWAGLQRHVNHVETTDVVDRMFQTVLFVLHRWFALRGAGTMLDMAEKDEDVVSNVRLPRDWLARADALVEHLEKDEAVRSIARPSRSTVLRIAVIEGLKVLEAKYLATTSRTKGKR